MLGCADTSFGVPYTCRICVVLVSSLLYHVIIFQKIACVAVSYCTRVYACAS